MHAHLTADWNAIYLVCFGVGLALSFVSVLTGFGHLQIGHHHLHVSFGQQGASSGSAPQHAPRSGTQPVSPLNGFSIVAFLCWFGGTGYLLHHAGVFGAGLVLLFSVLSGVAGASLVFWFLAKVLLRGEQAPEPDEAEMPGVIGRLSAQIPAGGFGEILYSQNGARRSAAVRADDGRAIERGAEVIVMRYQRGVGYVRRWDDFEHGLLSGQPAERSER